MAARHGSKWLIKGEPSSWKGQKFQRWFQRYGLLTVFVPAVTPVIPFPMKVFVVSAGALRTNFYKFLLVVLVARVIRYFGEAYLGLHLGAHAEAFLRRNAWTLLGVALAMAMGLYVLLRLIGRRSQDCAT
jgi:membrane protein DedA with SNARE-associated domain